MFTTTFTVTGISDLMFGKPSMEKKMDSETYAQFEERTWKNKVPGADGHVYINPFCVTNSLVSAAKWLGRKVDGRSGFTGRFQKGLTPGAKVLLYRLDGEPMTIADVEPIMLFVPADGKHGGPKRVERVFPTAHQWVAKGHVHVWDGKITPEQLRDHLEAVGRFIGWGSMRVENGGINGRFTLDKIEFSEME